MQSHPLCTARVHARHTPPRIVTCTAVPSDRQLTLSVKGLPQQGTAAPQALVSTLCQVPNVASVKVTGDQVTVTTEHAYDASTIATLLQQIRSVDNKYLVLPYAEKTWQWRGHRITYAEAGLHDAPPIVMVHGFGASAGHFRKLIQLLSLDYHVLAVDLLGFGGSDKPIHETYSPSLWATQVTAFLAEVVQRPAVLVGNSIGSQVVAATAAQHPTLVAGLCLLNCTGAMNARGLYQDDPRLLLLMPVFAAFEAALKVPAIAAWMFDGFRSRARVATILTSPQAPVYANQSAVNDELLDILTRPAQDPGAQEVFVQVFTGDPGQRPEASMEAVTHCPVQVQWGEDDPWTPINGTVAAYFKNLAQQQPGRVQFVPLPGTGHCPQDDRPELVGKAMKAWLEESVFCDKVSATKEKQERGNVVRASGGKKEKQKERGNKKNKQGHTQLPT